MLLAEEIMDDMLTTILLQLTKEKQLYVARER